MYDKSQVKERNDSQIKFLKKTKFECYKKKTKLNYCLKYAYKLSYM